MYTEQSQSMCARVGPLHVIGVVCLLVVAIYFYRARQNSRIKARYVRTVGTSRDSSSLFATSLFVTGDVVKCKYLASTVGISRSPGGWFDGVIVGSYTNGHYDVAFFDGDVELSVQPQFIKPSHHCAVRSRAPPGGLCPLTTSFQFDDRYPGFLFVPSSIVFGGANHSFARFWGSNDSSTSRALASLRAAVQASRADVCGPSDFEQTHRTNIHWNYVKDDLFSKRNHWEATIPALHLTQRWQRVLQRHSHGFVHYFPNSDDHFSIVQSTSCVLAIAILSFLRKAGPPLPPNLLFIGLQISDSEAGTFRSPHIDPTPIAALLATLTLEGEALISVDIGSQSSASAITIDKDHFYFLTGSELVYPVRHSVQVGTSRRLAITFRFTNVDLDWQ